MNNYIYIALLLYMTINGFGAGAYYQHDDELNWTTFFGVLLYLVFGTLIIVGFLLYEFGKEFYEWFMATTQIKFWWCYHTGTFKTISGKRLLQMNNNIRYIQTNLLADKHIKHCMAMLNRQYEFDYEKFKEEQNTVDVFKQPNETYTLNKNL